MLDQNTDRMWYVIGAVLVGAAIILIANGTLPDMFASVTDSFENVSKNAVEGVEQLNFETRQYDEFEAFYSTIDNYDSETDTFTITIDPDKAHSTVDSGIGIIRGSIEVPFNHMHIIRYDLYVPFDMTSRQDVNTMTPSTSIKAWRSPSDNDEWETRRFNGQQAVLGEHYNTPTTAPIMSQDIPGGKWITMEYSYTNTDPTNVDKLPIHDRSTFGAMVTDDITDPFTIQIRNIRNIIIELE